MSALGKIDTKFYPAINRCPGLVQHYVTFCITSILRIACMIGFVNKNPIS